MRTLVSLRALSLGLASTLGLNGCGGKAMTDDPSAGTSGSGTGGSGTGGFSTGGASTGGASTGGGPAFAFPCTNPTPIVDAEGRPSSTENCESGGLHRIGPVDCMVAVPRSDVECTSSVSTNECRSDADCTAGPYGYCTGTSPVGTCGCNYGCHTDADCAAGAVCVCHPPVGGCMPAACASDADCQPGLECRGFQDPNSYICGAPRFECQTPYDECDGSEDCAGMTCLADAAGVHRCQSFSCGVPGRPFLVDGVAVTADSMDRSDWLSDAGLAHDGATCRTLAEHWTRAGLLEHASIAAFARFTLQLLQLGAPARLVEGAERAMADEIVHARLCFAQATRYGGRPVGPSTLPTDGCMGPIDLASVVRTVAREGCIGETVAAVEAAEALAHASDSHTRNVLAIITRDETRHAELAWDFVRWAIEPDQQMADVLAEELQSARAPGGAACADVEPSAAELDYAAHGLLPAGHLQQLRARTLREVVAPLGRALIDHLAVRAA